MHKFKKSQILILFLLILLLSITPFLSPSFRRTYLYFLLNLLIISLGADAGLLSIILSNPVSQENTHCQKQTHYSPAVSPANTPKPTLLPPADQDAPAGKVNDCSSIAMQKPKVVEKSASEKMVTTSSLSKVARSVKGKKCPSTPSLFFIASDENDEKIDDVVPAAAEAEHDVTEAEAENETEYDVAVEQDVLSGQELFTKAETFIGNFYKQLKMQREDSWNRIHGMGSIQKPFNKIK